MTAKGRYSVFHMESFCSGEHFEPLGTTLAETPIQAAKNKIVRTKFKIDKCVVKATVNMDGNIVGISYFPINGDSCDQIVVITGSISEGEAAMVVEKEFAQYSKRMAAGQKAWETAKKNKAFAKRSEAAKKAAHARKVNQSIASKRMI
jgi:hypothetical protein